VSPRERKDLFPGALEMMVLQVLQQHALHGYALVQHIRRRSNDLLQVEEGSLYPALHRMEQQGWLKAEWGTTSTNREAKFYSLTAKGRKQLGVEQEIWARLTEGVGRVLTHA
jgi:transcriptional regulator